MRQRICTEEGCSAPHRARGLCVTHYNRQHRPDRHARVVVSCAVCGAQIERRPTQVQRFACSTECRRVLQFGRPKAEVATYSWARDAARRAAEAGAVVLEIFEREEIFERDEWTCHICGELVDRDASPFDPISATVDHVVALSRGGEHSRANVRCAHLRCNSIKADLAA